MAMRSPSSQCALSSKARTGRRPELSQTGFPIRSLRAKGLSLATL
jgi:hypothetical protein